MPPKYETEKYVPLFPDLQDSPQSGEKRFNELQESGRLQAILNFLVDAYPLKWDRPDMQPHFSLIAAVLAVVATMLPGLLQLKEKPWSPELLVPLVLTALLGLLEVLVLWLMLLGFRKLYRLRELKRYLEKESPDSIHPPWKASYQIAAALFAAGLVTVGVGKVLDSTVPYHWLAAVLVLLAVGLLPALTTVAVARAYNALLDAWDAASLRPEFVAYNQRLSGHTEASEQSGRQGDLSESAKGAQSQQARRALARLFSRVQLLAGIGAVLTGLLWGSTTGLAVTLWRAGNWGTFLAVLLGILVALAVYLVVRPTSGKMASLVHVRKLFLDDLITDSESDQMRRKCLKDGLLYE